MAEDGPDGDVRVSDLSDAELYALVRTAFKDALLDVIGTVLLVGLGLLLVWAGLAGAVATGTGERPVFAVVGVVVALAGVYVAAAALEYVPSVESFLRAD